MQGYKCWDEKLQILRRESGSTCWSVRCLVSSLDLPKALPETCGVVCSFAQYDHDDDDDDDDYDYDDYDDGNDDDDLDMRKMMIKLTMVIMGWRKNEFIYRKQIILYCPINQK